jgi:type IV secretion system protein VirB4
VLRFDLTGMDDELAVLSGRLEAMPALDRARAEYGDDPRDFLEPWLAEAKRIAARSAREKEDA